MTFSSARNRRVLGAVFLTAALSACAGNQSIFRTPDLERTSIITDAKQRVVLSLEATDGPGVNSPNKIVCAEPSPDVTQALSNSFSAILSASSSEGSNVDAQTAFSAAESVAQLGERLATIQLLRDGFYRACEAYANGAISDTTYAMVISRTDEVIATLLTAELAAGAFGRPSAAIGSDAQATTSLPDDQAAGQGDDQQTPNETASVDSQASGQAVPVNPVGTTSPGGSADIAAIHRTFMQDNSVDAFLVACVSALDRSFYYESANASGAAQQRVNGTTAGKPRLSAFTEICRQFFAGAQSPFQGLIAADIELRRERERSEVNAAMARSLETYLANCGTAPASNSESCRTAGETLRRVADAVGR